MNIAAAASDVSAVGSLSRHRLREFVLTNHVEQLTAAIDEDVVVGLLEKVVDILFPPKVSDDLRAVEDIAKTEHASGRRHLFADEGKSPKQFAFHARRSMVYQEYVGPIAFNRLENQRLPPRLHCFKAFKTVPGFVLFRADFDNRWEGLHLQTCRHGP